MSESYIRINKEKFDMWVELAGTNSYQLSKDIDFDAGSLHKMVNGELEPSKTLIKKLLNKTKLPFDSLFKVGDEDEG